MAPPSVRAPGHPLGGCARSPAPRRAALHRLASRRAALPGAPPARGAQALCRARLRRARVRAGGTPPFGWPHRPLRAGVMWGTAPACPRPCRVHPAVRLAAARARAPEGRAPSSCAPEGRAPRPYRVHPAVRLATARARAPEGRAPARLAPRRSALPGSPPTPVPWSPCRVHPAVRLTAARARAPEGRATRPRPGGTRSQLCRARLRRARVRAGYTPPFGWSPPAPAPRRAALPGAPPAPCAPEGRAPSSCAPEGRAPRCAARTAGYERSECLDF